MTHFVARCNSLKFKNILMMDLLQTCSFSLHKHDCCLDSHSDGTHWLQRISSISKWWYAKYLFPWRNKLINNLWWRVHFNKLIFMSGWTISLIWIRAITSSGSHHHTSLLEMKVMKTSSLTVVVATFGPGWSNSELPNFFQFCWMKYQLVPHKQYV